MPDAAGNIKGSGWTRKQAEGWERAFGSKVDLAGQSLHPPVRCIYCDEVRYDTLPHSTVMPAVDRA